MVSRFCNVEMGAPIEIFALNKACLDDTFENKVNLGIGAYRTDEGKPWVLPVVRQVEKILANDETKNKEYLPILGLEEFSLAASKMVLGSDSSAFKENRVFSAQCLSGTGALRVGAEFLATVLKYNVFYTSEPTWENHNLLFKNSGFSDGRTYRYWDNETRGLNIEGLLDDLRQAPCNAVVVLHACAHNPTGCDPNKQQWKQIADVMEEKNLFPLFDTAYQGFATGDLEKDAWAVRYFVERGFEMFVAQSFAKNFGLYNERVGNLNVILRNPDELAKVKSQVTLVIRGMYSNPPSHGVRIVSYVLHNAALFAEWKDNIRTMSSRIIEMRQCLRDALEQLATPGDWSHITSQIGMFSYTGLTEIESMHMVSQHHVYMLRSGRISMCGLTKQNIDYVANCIHETLTNKKFNKL